MADDIIDPAHSLQIRRMQYWIEDFIVDLNICPFAKREVTNQSIRYKVCDATNDDAWYEHISAELYYLEAHPEIATTILLLPPLDTKFESFLNVAGFAQQINELQGYSGVFQFAHFHPDYVFSDAPPEDPANYTNRAPHAALHLLREASVERAVRSYRNAEEIPQHNIERLRTLGMTEVKRRFMRSMQAAAENTN